MIDWFLGSPATFEFTPEGFGANAVGGESQTVYHVTNLNDSGAGSLRSLLESGASNRYVVFDVGGTLSLSSDILVTGSYITIDGSSAPSPGVTLTGAALSFEDGADHIIVKSLRSRNAPDDGFRIYGDVHDLLFHQCSSSHLIDGQDGCLDISQNYSTGDAPYNITVQWSILHMRTDGSDGGVLLLFKAYNVTVHHCILSGNDRLPLTKWSESGVEATDITCDLVNNISWDWGYYAGEIDGDPHYGLGTGVDGGSHDNVRNCFYQSNVPYTDIGDSAIVIDPFFGTNGKVYTDGNYSGNGFDVDSVGNVGTPYSAPAVSTDSVSVAVDRVLANAGCRGTNFGLDTLDQGVVDDITENANI